MYYKHTTSRTAKLFSLTYLIIIELLNLLINTVKQIHKIFHTSYCFFKPKLPYIVSQVRLSQEKVGQEKVGLVISR